MHTSQSVESVDRLHAIDFSKMEDMKGCFALVWARGVDDQKESPVLEAVKSIEGVNEACFSRREPYILLASYDPETTSTAKILETIEETGVQARIVGC